MQALARGLLTLEGELDRAAYVFTGAGYQQEKALILCEVYRKDGIWRFSVVDSGFNGGLSALLAHFGGEEVKPDPPTPAPAPPEPKVNLSKISLKQSGASHPGPGQQLRCRRSAPLHQAGQGRPLRRQRQRRKHGLLPAGADRLRRGFRLHL